MKDRSRSSRSRIALILAHHRFANRRSTGLGHTCIHRWHRLARLKGAAGVRQLARIVRIIGHLDLENPADADNVPPISPHFQPNSRLRAAINLGRSVMHGA